MLICASGFESKVHFKFYNNACYESWHAYKILNITMASNFYWLKKEVSVQVPAHSRFFVDYHSMIEISLSLSRCLEMRESTGK